MDTIDRIREIFEKHSEEHNYHHETLLIPNYNWDRLIEDLKDAGLLNIENSVGVSDATTEDGALARDREWNASGEDVGSSIASEHVPIGNRISDEKYCTCEIPNWTIENINYCVKCDKVIDWGVQIL